MSERFDEVVGIMAKLRGEGGCPWDRKQTRESLKPYLIEEAYEVLEAIEEHNDCTLKEELGDLLLQILFHAQIGHELETFTIEDVLQTLREKLIRRHPHVFGDSTVKDAAEVVHRWEEIKRQEKSAAGQAQSALDGVPRALPALLRAYQLQVRAAHVGFDWPQNEDGYAQVVDKVHEELKEIDQARRAAEHLPVEAGSRRLEDEVGDLLFALVNLARVLKVNPEDALRNATNRFASRFQHMERGAQTEGRNLRELSLAEMDQLWDKAKAEERKGSQL